ncbi:bacterioferritin comigratory protein [Colwellia sp. MB3u-55]|jgi:hypothetical protein|uniref:bacterioferritin comigratory protein n=1 Tax=Colwellia sp. MB3u-55 TaxID=2759810 RepID=UPI0015F4A25D|nr:bacterioferritin comigratory protein [Colwellia sp. MB3u-55]MBA6253138.1 bacterioferritin comigratory protein [Colwellia sp. MB3u-55]
MNQSTKKKFLDALDRLIKGQPENRELRLKAKAGKLKINDSTVEKEAGLSVGSLRNHEDIKTIVKNKSLNNRVEQSESTQCPIELLQEEVKKLKKEKTQANKKRAKYLDLAKSHETALAYQAASHIKMVQELMEMVPAYEREKAMDKVVNTRADNVIDGKFR